MRISSNGSSCGIGDVIGASAVVAMGVLGVIFGDVSSAEPAQVVGAGRAAGHRADGHDNDTSARAGDQRGDPERDRDHAIGLHAGYQAVVAAGSTRRTGLCPVTLRLVHRYCGACGVLVTVTMVGMAATAVALLAAFDPLTEGIRNLHDSGNPANMRTPLATLAALLDRLGRYEPAARIAGFALSPLTSASVPEIATAIAHLRDVLGDQTYESLARKGETMTTAAMATYAYDQIDQARAELNAVN